jgi:hypothetical protein
MGRFYAKSGHESMGFPPEDGLPRGRVLLNLRAETEGRGLLAPLNTISLCASPFPNRAGIIRPWPLFEAMF